MKKLSYAIRIMRQRGIGFFWIYFWESIWFDLRHGTSTFARVPKEEQAIDDSSSDAQNGLLYVASFSSVIRRTVEIAATQLGPERFAASQFVDLGSGKGKALLVFAKFFGDKVRAPALGIEYDPVLAALSERNVARCAFARGRVQVHADTAQKGLAHIASDCPVIYLYNSFQGDTLRSVLGVLAGMPHVLIYVDPVENGMLNEFGYVRVTSNSGRYNADTWLVARSSALEPAPRTT